MKKVLLTLIVFAGLLGCRESGDGSLPEPLPVEKGGTGADNASDALTNLNAASVIEPNAFAEKQTFNGTLRAQGPSLFLGPVDFLGQTIFSGKQIIRPQVAATSGGELPKLLEFWDTGGRVIASIDTAGTFAGSGAELDNLDASRITAGRVPDGHLADSYDQPVSFSNEGNVFTGDGSGLTAVPAVALNDLLFGARLSDGCVLVPNQQPDCSACGAIECRVLANNPFPETNWMNLGSYTFTQHGMLDIELARSLLCRADDTGVVRLDVVAEVGDAPGANTPIVLASADVTLFGLGGATYRLAPQPVIHNHVMTQAKPDLELDTEYIVYLRATVIDGAPTCFLGAADWELVFKPMTGSKIAIPSIAVPK